MENLTPLFLISLDLSASAISIIVGVLGSLIGVVVWLVRLEGKITHTEKQVDTQNKWLETIDNNLTDHRENTGVHHDARVFAEFKANIDLKFTQVNGQIAELKSDFKENFKTMDSKLDKILGN
jgi:uncharacterized protein YpuA (DUF1002 family)